MAARPTARGDVAQILNGLVRDGIISGYRTNLFDRERTGEIVVTVTAPEADDVDGLQEKVSQALASLTISATVHVELP